MLKEFFVTDEAEGVQQRGAKFRVEHHKLLSYLAQLYLRFFPHVYFLDHLLLVVAVKFVTKDSI